MPLADLLDERAEHGILDGDEARRALGDGEADGRRAAEAALAEAVGAAGARVARALVADVGRAGGAGDLGAGAVAEVEQVCARELVERGLVAREALGLDVGGEGAAEVRAFVPGDAEVAEVVEQGGSGGGDDAVAMEASPCGG